MASAYSSHQISEYLAFIGLPRAWHPDANPTLTYEYLHVLHVHQISAIPYENLSLHYSVDRQIPLDPQVLFDKFMRRKRGGYCMETSIFYNHILRALGFQVYTAGVKIRLRKDNVPHGDYVGWMHIVNIVTLPDQTKWMVDVGFGGDGATRPVPLTPTCPPLTNLGTQKIRLTLSTIPEQVDQSRPYWIYQYRNSPDLPWNSYYAFPEWEFSEADFTVMNFFTSQNPEGFQRKFMMGVKFLRGQVVMEDNGVEGLGIVGKVMLAGNVVKRNMGGKTETVAVLKSERERIEALREWFGIELTPEEQEGIKGYVSEIKTDVNA